MGWSLSATLSLWTTNPRFLWETLTSLTSTGRTTQQGISNSANFWRISGATSGEYILDGPTMAAHSCSQTMKNCLEMWPPKAALAIATIVSGKSKFTLNSHMQGIWRATERASATLVMKAWTRKCEPVSEWSRQCSKVSEDRGPSWKRIHHLKTHTTSSQSEASKSVTCNVKLDKGTF